MGIGSIPASAGEPRAKSVSPLSQQVYPRECGGTMNLCIFRVTNGGLSPRVRGNHNNGVMIGAHIGSIPASAGEPLQNGI